MKKIKLFVVGTVWTLFYASLVASLALFLPYTPFRIALNPFADWVRLIEDFANDNLVVDTGKELLTIIVFIGFWPVWFWGLRRSLKKKWFKKGSPVFSTSQKIIIKKHKMERPPMASAPVNFTKPANYVEGKSEYEMTPSSEVPSTIPDESEKQTNSVNTAALLPKIKEIIQGTDMDVFENVLLGDISVPMVVASDERAYLLTFIGTNQEWVADEEVAEDGEAPTWFSSEGLVPSPFYQMKKAAELLQEQEPGSMVVPVVVILDGEVLNYESMAETWSNLGGYVVRFENGQPEQMMTLDTLLNEKK